MGCRGALGGDQDGRRGVGVERSLLEVVVGRRRDVGRRGGGRRGDVGRWGGGRLGTHLVSGDVPDAGNRGIEGLGPHLASGDVPDAGNRGAGDVEGLGPHLASGDVPDAGNRGEPGGGRHGHDLETGGPRRRRGIRREGTIPSRRGGGPAW
ncbi:hypothetical protein D187_008435 [Cystobacter fuscus DSM 2262]|uniref:Uncharacterized protein n=1 Tax=Cystobacter fuscus (strain ATCC 25194 / DSM 2262 / NBRC 100088 / M29) TaxID=1242864 RepID=S9R014_CYSF2|nr:hypothetical protein D187_008435 [Cystobacter fuscus DSM 2262]